MPLILWPLESYKAFWNSFLLCERRAVAWIILGGSLRPGHCIWGWTDIRLTWEMKRVRTEAEQVEGRQLCRLWSGKPVGNTPVWIQLYVSLHRQVTFIQELSTHCMRLGLSSRVTNLHLENTFQGTTLPCTACAPWPSPAQKAQPCICTQCCAGIIVSSPHTFSPRPLEVLLGPKFSFLFCALLRFIFLQNQMHLFFLLLSYLKNWTLLYLFSVFVNSHMYMSICNQQGRMSPEIPESLPVCYLVAQLINTGWTSVTSLSFFVRIAPSVKSLVIKSERRMQTGAPGIQE